MFIKIPKQALDIYKDLTSSQCISKNDTLSIQLAEEIFCELTRIFKYRRVIDSMIDSLGARDKLVITKRFLESKTFEEVGKLLSVTRERIRQIEIMAVRKMRQRRNLLAGLITIDDLDDINIRCPYKQVLRSLFPQRIERYSKFLLDKNH